MGVAIRKIIYETYVTLRNTMRMVYPLILISILMFLSGTSVYAGTFKFLGVISQDLSSFGNSGIAIWPIPEATVSGTPQIINSVNFSSSTGDGYVTDGVNSIISCNLSFELDDKSVRTYSVTVHSGGSEAYPLPESVQVTKLYAGSCSGRFINTNNNTVDLKSDRNNGYASVMTLGLSGPGYTQGLLYLGLKGSLSTTPACSVDIDNPGIVVNGTAYDYKQGFTVDRVLKIECVENSPSPGISLTSTGRIIDGCLLLQTDSNKETGPTTCVFDGNAKIPVDLVNKTKVAVDQTGKAEKQISFKISSADDQEGLSGGVYSGTILIVVSPL